MPRHFFIAGAQRCATTYLYRMLDQHPDICMATPMRPEPKYFLRQACDDDMDSYRKAYFARPDAACLGEKSTSYIERPDAADRIARALPDATIVFVLRDPVDRALSNYRFSVMNGLEPLSLPDALDAEESRLNAPLAVATSVSPYAYVARGRYFQQLAAWSQRFDASRLRIVTTERLVEPSGKAVADVFAALCVRRDVPLQGLGAAVNDSATMDVPDAIRRRLRHAFAESNRKLSEFYGVDLGAWQ
jgi:hypothetical protein